MNYVGTFKLWNTERGYGFIAPLERGRDVFAHCSALPLGVIPYAGMRVSYDLGTDKAGREMAVNVEPI
jgi:CspA family cold shock protein